MRWVAVARSKDASTLALSLDLTAARCIGPILSYVCSWIPCRQNPALLRARPNLLRGIIESGGRMCDATPRLGGGYIEVPDDLLRPSNSDRL